MPESDPGTSGTAVEPQHGEPITERRRSGRLLIGKDAAGKVAGMGGDPTMTEDRKLLEPTERPDFLDTDPWRALRIPWPMRARASLWVHLKRSTRKLIVRVKLS